MRARTADPRAHPGAQDAGDNALVGDVHHLRRGPASWITHAAGVPGACLCVAVFVVVHALAGSGFELAHVLSSLLFAIGSLPLFLSPTLVTPSELVWGLLRRRVALANVDKFVEIDDLPSVRGVPTKGIAALVNGARTPVVVTTSGQLGRDRRARWLATLETARTAARPS